ncbi:MAG: ABC transporter ATP-binding protein [Bacteroidales bacterium]|nr:ABC transporter ATP-binding protein [Bacteroidales bacterium]
MSKNHRNTKGTTEKSSLIHLLRPYSGLVGLLVLFTILGNALNLLIPLIISQAIDSFSQGNFSIHTIVLRFTLAAVFIMFFTYLQGIVQTYAAEKTAKDLRERVAGIISRQSYAYVLRANPSKLLTNLTSDIDSIKTFVAQAVSSIISSLFMLAGASVLLLLINWKLALAVLCIIPIVGTAFYIVLRKVRVLFRKSREVIDWLNRVINESILGASLIRILNSQISEYRKFVDANTTSKDLGLSILSLFAALIPVINFVANLAILTVLVFGGHLVISGDMTLGNFAAFNSYITILIFPIIIIGFMSNLIAHASASYQRVREVLDIRETEEAGSCTDAVSGTIEIRNVTLVYGDKPALKEINLNIIRGSKTAIIGPTAAGKSQLLYLLTGLIKPTQGEISFDGKNIGAYRKEDFYRQVGLVFQDSIIFNLSVRENIAFSQQIPDEVFEKAIVTSELKSFIDSLPQKLDTVISERGTNLSGGQKQRLMLARALALNPSVLLLDDFTARVDQATEERIMKNIADNYPNITIIAVAQKIASIKHYEQIILLMEGEIIATGDHCTLLETCPEYMQIYNSQRSTSIYGV